MSSLTVTLEPVTVPVEADPAGFTDGLVAGWNGLVATLNGIVIALGFLLPWLVVIAIAGLIVWAIVRAVRRRRAARADAARASAATPTAERGHSGGRDSAACRRGARGRSALGPVGARLGRGAWASTHSLPSATAVRVASPIHSVPW